MTTVSVLAPRVTLTCSVTAAQSVDVDLVVVGVPARAVGLPPWLGGHAAALDDLPELGTVVVHRTRHDGFRARAAALVPVESASPTAWRAAGRAVGDDLRSFSRVALTYPDVAAHPATIAFIRGFCEARYRFHHYRKDAAAVAAEVTVVGVPATDVDRLTADLRVLAAVEEAVAYSRDLTNTPARDLTPVAFASAATALGADLDLVVETHDADWLTAERFAGLVHVGAGSPNPPRLAVVSYKGPAASSRPVVLVGKGVTFDSGGLSLKKSEQMVEMKSDMAGAAVVLAVMRALGELRPPDAHVIGLMPLAENLPGPQALRPGDIISHRNGLTTEVVNTDCEGRLILADTLVYAAEFDPTAIIDLATLTYATISALGMEVTAALGTSRELVAELQAAGDLTGDPYWELPLWEPYRKLIESPVADLRNEETGDGAGAITAALYLREFVGDNPWAHLDIGGTAYLDDETGNLAAGATGWGVRSLYHFITDRPATRQGDLA